MDELYHYGTPQMYDNDPHGSGRYRQGTGKNPGQHPDDFLARVAELTKKYNGNEKEVANALGMSTTELRKQKSLAKEARRAADIKRVRDMHEHGVSGNQISKITGIPEPTVRNYLKDYALEKATLTQAVADKLEKELEHKKYIDIGKGSEVYMGVSANRMETAVQKLQDKGYYVDKIYVEQAGNPGKYTTVKILGKPGTEKRDIFKELDQIKHPGDNFTSDNGKTWKTLEPPTSLDSSRIKIRYAEEGGVDKDGVIEIRRGVADLSLGDSRYAQVRIAVDGTHYLKGMAMYSNSMPEGVDVIFNTNKPKGTPMMSSNKDDPQVLKPLKKDPDNPFGALIKENKYDPDGNLLTGSGQYHYIDKDGKEKLSPINKVKEEGEWDEWSKSLSAQFLSKQTYGLAKQQLDVTFKNKKAEYQEISSITNPIIKKELLDEFANQCDKDSVHLKAAALPRQAYKVILPMTKINEHEIYAPTYKDGEEVALIRYPHGGTFEIPLLRVNNKNVQAKSLINNAPDAVGINAKVAERLSGADFDGDTVLVIPTKNNKIKSTAPLEGLKDFNPSAEYPGYPGMKPMTKRYQQIQMGIVSNLITDMTLQGADQAELARAVRHSMVVIDAVKHGLDYRLSYKQNAIEALKKKYQYDPEKDKNPGGPHTLISKAKNEVDIPERRQNYHINPSTGEKEWTNTNRTFLDYKTGKIRQATMKSTQMAETNDARTLISKSNTRMENLYASYANNLKALANQARKDYMAEKTYKRDPSATKAYSDEVSSLKDKLMIAKANLPKERQAQLLANSIYKQKVKDFDLEKDELKKAKTQALAEARARTGAIKRSDRVINITDREWEAIQAHAISNNTLKEIIDNTDLDSLKQRAMPRNRTVPPAKVSLIKSLAKNHTQAEIAEMVGVSTSTVSKVIAGKL